MQHICILRERQQYKINGQKGLSGLRKRRGGRANLGHEGKGRLETIQKIVAAVAYLR